MVILYHDHPFQLGSLQFGSHRVFFFADDVVLTESSVCDLRLSLERLAAECDAVGMRISASKCEAVLLGREPTGCLLRVGNVSLPPVKEFKSRGVLFTSEGEIGESGPRCTWFTQDWHRYGSLYSFTLTEDTLTYSSRTGTGLMGRLWERRKAVFLAYMSDL